jgi:hypothetical protein
VVRGGFGKKIIEKIVADTETMKNTPVHVCTKTVFVGSPSTQNKRISSFNNLFSFNN